MTEAVRPGGAQEAPADQIDDIVPSHGYRKVPVVGLGGSAGSIEALQAFFTTMPPKSPLAFVVVIHLSPDHESMLPDLLQRCTKMPVMKVQGPLEVQPGTVYVIPPGKALETADGRLELATLPSDTGRHVAVDIFFRALADSHGPHAAAVVLSGLDGDGAIGIKRIKERGGLTVAQDPSESEYGGMPSSAIGTGMVDWVLPVSDMPARLLSYFRLEKDIALPTADASGAVDDERPASAFESELRDVLAFLRTRTGRDFSNYKRGTVLRRVGRRMQVNGIDNLPGYLGCLRTRPGECAALLQDLLISVTNFFRDPECWEALQAQIPALFEDKGPGDVVRVWVIASATGEEAYSMAMLLAEHARTLEAPPLIQIFATDLDEDAVRTAREGVYPPPIAADVSAERLRRFFQRDNRGWRVRRELRELVLFAVHDVLHDSPFSRLDMASCRNLLIYLNREAQKRVTETLHFALLPRGKLFLGSSESIDEDSPLFTVLDKKHRIYAQQPARSGLPVPSAPANLNFAMDLQHFLREAPVVGGLALDPPNMAAAPRQAGRMQSWGELHLQMLEHIAPPSVLLNGDYDIVHLSPGAGRFLRLGGGEPSRNLLHVLPAELRIEVRAALYQASQTREAVELPSVRTGASAPITIRVMPLQEGGQLFFVVTFSEAPVRLELPAAEGGPRPEPDPLAHHLDREIERLKLHLRDTVEQYEASTEELKASNEELQAMNEELRAATEELETSREELQSINEELTTVNQELKSKVDQLGHANSDMHNLMDATNIATVFLDRELCITRYTPAAVSLFNLIPGDVGRPLTDMATELDYPELGDDARKVLRRLVPVEREVGQSGGKWYLSRLLPYRTLEDRIAGVVFTFIDITERKQAEEMRLWLSAVVSSTSDAIISFALDGTILSWNSGAERIFGYTAPEAIGQPLSMLAAPGREDEQQRLLAEVLGGRPVEEAGLVQRHKDGKEIRIALTASPVRDNAGHVLGGTALVRGIGAKRRVR